MHRLRIRQTKCSIPLQGCEGSPDPTEYITDLERRVQENVDEIWRQISIVDSIGRMKIQEDCGSDYLVDFVTGSRNVAKLLTTMRRSLRSASGHLECDRLNPIYTQIVHDTLCTEAASASSYGFILFLMLGISTMTMISLRTSLLQSMGEDEKVYHDEDEIAENMIVDEHEDYLQYISKYKHEWQEYNGIENNGSSQMTQHNSLREKNDKLSHMHFASFQAARNKNDPDSEEESFDQDDEVPRIDGENFRAEGEGYQGSDEHFDVALPAGPQGLKIDVFPASMFKASSSEESIDELSYPSLKNKSFESENVIDVGKAHGSLLPPPENPDYMDGSTLREGIVLDATAPRDVHSSVRERREPEGMHARTCKTVNSDSSTIALDDSGGKKSFHDWSGAENFMPFHSTGDIEEFNGLPSTPQSQESIDLWIK